MAKVMLVEDDNNLREIYEARLAAEGYEIVAAHDGEEALALAVKERPDLIISDIMMPKISGFDMLDILRSTPETKNTKVIMMTALGQAEDRERADKLGADRYLVKSQVTLEDVVKVASDILNDTGIPAPTAAPAEPTNPPAVQNAAPANNPPAAGSTAQVASVPVVAAPPAEPATAAAPPAVVTPDTIQTEAEETQTAEQQIQDFVANNPTLSTAADAPEVTAQPAKRAAPPPASKPTSIPVIEVPEKPEEAGAEAPAGAPPAPPEPEAKEVVPEPPSHKKLVIQPTGNALTPSVDLNALLAKEQEAGNVAPPKTSTIITPSDGGDQAGSIDPGQIAL